MTSLTDHGAAVASDLAQRYGVSDQAVQSLMAAVVRGGGTQAQFDIPELGGMGQWSWGGMTMVGDMFNTNLQALVSNLCGEIANAAQQGALFPPAPVTRRSWQGHMKMTTEEAFVKTLQRTGSNMPSASSARPSCRSPTCFPRPASPSGTARMKARAG
jgi:hypothetical protein